MRNRATNPEGGWPEMESHDKFLELCALSVSSELTEKEQKILQGHLGECSDCQKSVREFEAAATVGMPLLHSHLTNPDSLEASSIPHEHAKTATAYVTGQLEQPCTKHEAIEQTSETTFPHRNGGRHAQVNWSYVWMPFAAAVVLTAALGIYS